MSAADVAAALAPFGVALVEAGVKAIKGQTTKEQAARETIGVLLSAIPREELIGYLTPDGAQRAEFLADMAERAKFAP